MLAINRYTHKANYIHILLNNNCIVPRNLVYYILLKNGKLTNFFVDKEIKSNAEQWLEIVSRHKDSPVTCELETDCRFVHIECVPASFSTSAVIR